MSNVMVPVSSESDVSQAMSRVFGHAFDRCESESISKRKMSRTSLDTRASLYIDTLQSQSLHDRSLEVYMDAVEVSISIYKVKYLGSHFGHNPS